MVLFLKRLIPKSITDIQTLAETRMEENIYLTNHYLSVSFVGSSSSDFFLKLMFCGILFFSPQYALSLSKFLSLYGLQFSHYTGQSQTVFLVQMAPSILSIEPTQHLYPAISCSSQKQFIQNKMYHLSFFSLFTYLPLKKKKKDIIMIFCGPARQLGITQILPFVFLSQSSLPTPVACPFGILHNLATECVLSHCRSSGSHSSSHSVIHLANISGAVSPFQVLIFLL